MKYTSVTTSESSKFSRTRRPPANLASAEWNEVVMMLFENEMAETLSLLRECDRDFLESLWVLFKPYADANFQREFERSHNLQSRFWEMYLGVALLKLGLAIIPRNKRIDERGPDICITDLGSRVWVEAIAPKPGAGPDHVEDIVADGHAQSVPDREITLRYCHGIYDKFEKLKGYRDLGIIQANEPCVIALSGGGVPDVWKEAMIPRVLQALFAIGQYEATVNPRSMRIESEGFALRDAICKQKGSHVRTDIFLDRTFALVSGVLFSYADVYNRPRTLGADFIFVHNSQASCPLPRGWLKIGHEYWVEDGKLRRRVWNVG